MLLETAMTWRNQLDKRLKPLGLSQAKWRVLFHLSIAEEHPLTQTALAQRLGIECPTLVGLLDRLEKDGWINRRDDSADRRTKAVHLTSKAQTTLKQIHSTADTLCHELLDNIPENELSTCMKVLTQIKNHASKNT